MEFELHARTQQKKMETGDFTRGRRGLRSAAVGVADFEPLHVGPTSAGPAGSDPMSAAPTSADPVPEGGAALDLQLHPLLAAAACSPRLPHPWRVGDEGAPPRSPVRESAGPSR